MTVANWKGFTPDRPAYVCPWRWVNDRSAIHVDRLERMQVEPANRGMAYIVTLTGAHGMRWVWQFVANDDWNISDAAAVALEVVGWDPPLAGHDHAAHRIDDHSAESGTWDISDAKPRAAAKIHNRGPRKVRDDGAKRAARRLRESSVACARPGCERKSTVASELGARARRKNGENASSYCRDHVGGRSADNRAANGKHPWQPK